MIFHRILIVYLSYFWTFSNPYTLLYHTENSLSMQYYDCIYSKDYHGQSIKYCRQLNETQRLQRDFNQSCQNGGQLWSFKNLSIHNVSSSDVFKWSSSMEQTDRYSKYLFNTSLDIGEKYICNCTNSGSFGKFCEYKFYGSSISFDEAVTKQFEPLKNFSAHILHDHINVGSQLHDNRPCYMTLECNSGLLCLDWRYICDGKQQCMDGLDEDHCEKLEFNECEDDEYRCANGMCIPEEYWIEGDYDCMDWTDETLLRGIARSGCLDKPSLICDEHLCITNEWSCGDGFCIGDGVDRHTGTADIFLKFCQNMRDVHYMCESVTRASQPWWTIDKGYCLPYPLAYQTLFLDTVSATENCSFFVKCALSNSLGQDCPCKNVIECRNLINSSCSGKYMTYPWLEPILAPYLYMVYVRDHDWTRKQPDLIWALGSIKCIGYQITSVMIWPVSEGKFNYFDIRLTAFILCNPAYISHEYRNYSGPHYDINCWNNSKTFNNRSYQVSSLCEFKCMSKYRVRDGIMDCLNGNDESHSINNSCPQIQRHRLQCSSSELTCLVARGLKTSNAYCSNRRDQVYYESDIISHERTNCIRRSDPQCARLRHYIQISSYNDDDNNEEILINNATLNNRLTTSISFRAYCDSFFDTMSGYDELPEFCKDWVCSSREYRCLSGQCILQNWVCDGEWDCNDGSDEQLIFTLNDLHEHNSKLMNLSEIKEQCYKQYRSDNTPFFNICNISHEYPCFRSDIADPFNLELNRPCINLTQIGDGKIDCLSGIDERNRLHCSELDMLGYHFLFNDSQCGLYFSLCTLRYPWTRGTDISYDSVCFHQEKLFKNGTISNCNNAKDVMCFNDICKKDARCNGKTECLHGEDEYRCPKSINSWISYRLEKMGKELEKLRLDNYPSLSYRLNNTDQVLLHISGEKNRLLDLRIKFESVNHITTVYEQRDSTVKSVYEIVRQALPNDAIIFEEHYLPFICNRGLAVKYYTGHTVCFCPPSFYGSQCEFYSDRITVLTHLNLTNYRFTSSQDITIIKVLVTFLFQNQTIDYHEFHVNPQFENDNNYIKQHIYFLYPRTKMFLQMKKNNRSGTQMYSVRFEAFNLYLNEVIQPIGVWQYPIYFDFLPSFRLSKVLRFHSPTVSSYSTNSLCSEYRCGKNGICQDIINSNYSSYFCSCHSGNYGFHCEFYDEECNNYCSPKSICKPNYRRNITGNQHPLCLCPVSTFGSTCYIKHNKCQQNPCMNEGTCIVKYDLNDTNSYFCQCTDAFQGDHCQYSTGTVDIAIMLSSSSILEIGDVVAVTVFYSNYDIETLKLYVRNQQVYSTLPVQLKRIFKHKSDTYAPTIATMKLYGPNYRNEEAKYYILYYYSDQKSINIKIDLTSENHCPLVQTLYSDNSTFNSTTAVFFYHHICRAKQNTNTTFTCFRDFNYFCICEFDHNRAVCFGYDRSKDQCSRCLFNGYCLQGESNVNFLCLCPRCYHGSICQYSTQLMSFTLDSLIVTDIQNNHQVSVGIYISIAVLIFFFGFFNNICSFLTFLRPKPRKFGVGNYLFIVSIIDQCSLSFLLFKIIYIILTTNGTLFEYKDFSLYSCKLISYLLSVFTRITYWLTSFVTIERLGMVLFPTSIKLKNPRLAISLSISTVLIICCMHIHEALYYKTIDDPSYTSVNSTLCVTTYTEVFVLAYNRVNVLLHYFIPFLIQLISITVMIIQTAFSRARATVGKQREAFLSLFKKQFRTQKELYITPMITVLSSLPQIILSFSYACGDLKQSWQRYSLLSAYFLSYLPQMLGFILYVLPSTVFFEEFRQTIIGKRLLRQQNVQKK